MGDEAQTSAASYVVDMSTWVARTTGSARPVFGRDTVSVLNTRHGLN